MLLTAYSLFLAVRAGIKLWLNAAVHWACRRDRWPPPDTPGRVNHVRGLIGTGVLLTVLPALVLVSLKGMAMGLPHVRTPRDAVFYCLIFTILCGGGFTVLLFENLKSVIAARPAESWPPGEGYGDDIKEATEY
jgi:hypothetical protein